MHATSFSTDLILWLGGVLLFVMLAIVMTINLVTLRLLRPCMQMSEEDGDEEEGDSDTDDPPEKKSHIPAAAAVAAAASEVATPRQIVHSDVNGNLMVHC